MKSVCIGLNLLAIATLLVSCNRKSDPSPVVQPSNLSTPSVLNAPVPPPTPSALVGPDFPKLAERFSASVVGITVFDETGKLLTHGSGFFVSEDGKFVTDASILKNGANGVVKTPVSKIFNVAGYVTRSDSRNLAVLKAEAQSVPFVVATTATTPAVGGRVAVVSSPIIKDWKTPLQGTIATRSNDANGDYYEISPAVAKARCGSLVIDDRGDIVGVLASRNESSDDAVVRPFSVVTALLSSSRTAAAPSWQSATPTPTPTATPSPTTTPSATPKPSSTPAKRSRLIYNPAPVYPTTARRSHFPLRGAGSYRILFGPDGKASSVQVQKTSGSELLDNAAMSGLIQWRAEPGPSWSITVPVTFQP